MSYCGSIYTAFHWCDFTQMQYRPLEVAENNIFRRSLGFDKYCSTSSMYVENRTDGFDARIRKLVYGFRESMTFLKSVEVVGEILIFAINHDFQCTNSVIKIMLCVFLVSVFFLYFVMLCIMYLYNFGHFFQLSIINEMMELCIRKLDVSSVFSFFTYYIS